MRSSGGFELLLCQDNSCTKLQVAKYGSCSTDELRCLGSGRIYIRPVQVDILLGDVAYRGVSALQGFDSIATDASPYGRVSGLSVCSPADIFSFISVQNHDIFGKT